MASVDNGTTVTLEGNPRSSASGNSGGNTIVNNSSSFLSSNSFNVIAPPDDGMLTMTFENNSKTPANGLYSNTIVNNSTQLNTNTFHYVSTETEVINTILFPASAYDSLVEPSIHFYKLRGYYVVGGIFETWVSNVSTALPPSGHTLMGITIVDEWTV